LVTLAREGPPERLDSLRFSDRQQMQRSMISIAKVALDKHRRDHVVTARHILEQIFGEVVFTRLLPEMMVRVDDRKRRLQHLFGVKREPAGIWIGVPVSSRDV
jgi:hypothetical protein